MRLIFFKTPDLQSYLAEDVRAYDGNIVNVSPQRGMQLLKAYPRNFFSPDIPVVKLGDPVHEPLTLSQITVLTIHYWPSDVLERCLLSGLPEEVEFIKIDNTDNNKFVSAAEALNHGIRESLNDVVICAHEDMQFGKNWFEDFIRQECRLKDWGALGIVGWELDRQMRWGAECEAVHQVKWLDECCIIINRKNGIWFDQETFRYFHCYGVDFCYQCYDKGLGVYVLAGSAHHAWRGYDHDQAWFDRLGVEQDLFNRKWKRKIL